MILGRHILVIFTIFQKNGLLVEIGHFEAFPANFGVTDLTLGDSRVAPKGFFLLYYPYPAPKLLAETFFGLGPDLVHLLVGRDYDYKSKPRDFGNHVSGLVSSNFDLRRRHTLPSPY